LFEYFGCETREEVYRKLGDDVRWIPVGNQPLEPAQCFAACETAADVKAAFDWPDPDEFDITPWLDALDAAEGYYRFSGNLSMFFHADGFNGFRGMQGYFTKMITHPDVVHAVTRAACDYYLKLNRRFFAAAGDRMEAYKVSHDLGTQLNLMMSREMLEEFVLPYIAEQIDLAHEFGYKALLHCCGAIGDIMPRLAELGVDLLHPIQAEVPGMDAESLAAGDYGMTYVGGIGTQQLLVHATPDEVRAEVRRVAGLLGPLVISPSHEAILPNVPPANIEAMADEVRRLAR